MFKPLTATLCLAASSALAEPPRVVADIAPVHGLAARVMQGIAMPDLLVAQGASPHDYALRPSDARALDTAGLVLWIGPDLTPGLAKPLETLAGSAAHIELIAAPGTILHDPRQEVRLGHHNHDDHDHDEHGHDHGDHNHEGEDHDDHGHDHDHDHDDHAHGDHGHDHSDMAHDPHAWLDPENGKVWLALIAEELARIDPDNADTYRANAEAGQREIDAATSDIAARLAPFADRPYVVFHDAYQYFEQRFDLSPAGAISLSDASDPSPARIAELREIVAETGASCVFSEPQFNSGLIDTVFDGSTVTTGVIDPLGTTLEPGAGFYPALLNAMADSLEDCLSR